MSDIGKQPPDDERRLDFSMVLGVMAKAKAAMEDAGTTAGEMPCPRCKTGTVSYVKAPNDHSRGACSTTDCMSWIE